MRDLAPPPWAPRGGPPRPPPRPAGGGGGGGGGRKGPSPPRAARGAPGARAPPPATRSRRPDAGGGGAGGAGARGPGSRPVEGASEGRQGGGRRPLAGGGRRLDEPEPAAARPGRGQTTALPRAHLPLRPAARPGPPWRVRGGGCGQWGAVRPLPKGGSHHRPVVAVRGVEWRFQADRSAILGHRSGGVEDVAQERHLRLRIGDEHPRRHRAVAGRPTSWHGPTVSRS